MSPLSQRHCSIFEKAKRSPTQLRPVFKKPKEAGLKLKPSKCEFFKKSLTYFGHRILEGGIETDNSKIMRMAYSKNNH